MHFSSHCCSKKRQFINVEAYIYPVHFIPLNKSWVYSGSFTISLQITADPLNANLILFSHQMAVCMDGKHGCQTACVWCSQEQSCLIRHIYFPFQLFLCSSQSNIWCLQKLLLQTDEVKSHHIRCDGDAHPGQSTYTKKKMCKAFRKILKHLHIFIMYAYGITLHYGWPGLCNVEWQFF